VAGTRAGQGAAAEVNALRAEEKPTMIAAFFFWIALLVVLGVITFEMPRR
jgi:hypothetical protein